jgi:hypothetical protein
MPVEPHRDHTYKVSFYGEPTGEQVEEEIQRARTVFGPGMRMHFKSTDDQRDGHSVVITFKEPAQTR